MNEFIVIFRTVENAENAGLSRDYLTAVGPTFVSRLRMFELPWALIRECAAYVKPMNNHWQYEVVDPTAFSEHLILKAAQYARQYCHPITIRID